jgi:hypothetical protein
MEDGEELYVAELKAEIDRLRNLLIQIDDDTNGGHRPMFARPAWILPAFTRSATRWSAVDDRAPASANEEKRIAAPVEIASRLFMLGSSEEAT